MRGGRRGFFHGFLQKLNQFRTDCLVFLSEVSGKNNKLKKCEGKLTNNRIMVWTCFKSEQRQNYSKGYEHESEKKLPKRETKSKLGTTG